MRLNGRTAPLSNCSRSGWRPGKRRRDVAGSLRVEDTTGGYTRCDQLIVWVAPFPRGGTSSLT